MTELTIPLPPGVFWPIAYLFAFTLACGVAYAFMAAGKSGTPDPLDRIKERLGAEDWPDAAVLAGLILWGALFVLLFLGLVLLIWEVLMAPHPAADDNWSFRFALIRIAGLTATLGAVVALPFTMARLRLTQKQAATAAEALFNDKINAASADLHAMRQRWDPELKENIWEDDITRRNAAIDRLEGLVKEEPEVAGRVSRLLSVYVRELSNFDAAEFLPCDATKADLEAWRGRSKNRRSDIEGAVQALGRLRRNPQVALSDVQIDLRGANLQNLNLMGLDLSDAHLNEVQAEGANFTETSFKNSSLVFANLRLAEFEHCNFNGADLNSSELQAAHLRSSQFVKANLSYAHLHQANCQEANFLNALLVETELVEVFASNACFNYARMVETNLHSASLDYATFQETNLRKACLESASAFAADFYGADLTEIRIDEHSGLRNAHLSRAAIRLIGLGHHLQSGWPLDEVFGDGTVNLAREELRPPHWPKGNLGGNRFYFEWQKWRKCPDNYEPPTPDEVRVIDAAE